MSGNTGFDDVGAVASAVKANESMQRISSPNLKREAYLTALLRETPMVKASSSRMIWLFVMREKCRLRWLTTLREILISPFQDEIAVSPP